jgi:RNA polymerase sigma-70 factor (ECF subfamily)
VAHDDSELVRRCLARDQAACADLVTLYARVVGTIISRVTRESAVVEDLVQETFLRAFRGLPYFAGRAKLSTWLCQIAHRVAIDHLRKAGRSPETDFAGSDDDDAGRLERLPDARVVGPENAAAREEMDQIVREGLAQLPERYRLPLVYAAIDGLDYSTIGTMLGVPVGTVKTLVFRGKQRLKDLITTSLAARTRR